MQHSQLDDVVSILQEGVYFVDSDRRITFWNEAAEQITGYAGKDVVGSKCSDNILRHVTAEGCELCPNGCPLFDTMKDGHSRIVEAYLHHKDGYRVPAYIRSVPLRDETGQITGAIEVFSNRNDRTALLTEIEQLKHESLTDALTGLGNRRYLEIMAEARFTALNNQKIPFGLIMIDIDHFKAVNDCHGHLVGDRVLQMSAKTIAGVLRPLDIAVRFGGEEFIVICPNVMIEELKEIAERIRNLVSLSWLDLENGFHLGITVSAGGTISTQHDDLASLIHRADKNMYTCKDAGRNRTLVEP